MFLVWFHKNLVNTLIAGGIVQLKISLFPLSPVCFKDSKQFFPLLLLIIGWEIIPLIDMRNKEIFLGTYEQFQNFSKWECWSVINDWFLKASFSFKEFDFSPQFVEATFAEHPPFDWDCLLPFSTTHHQSMATIFTVPSTYSEPSIFRWKRKELHVFIPTVLFTVFSHSSVLIFIPERIGCSGLCSLSSCLWCLIDLCTLWSNNFFNTVISAKGDI